MEHFSELAINTPNPFIKANLFGEIFEELPTFKELESGTPKLSPLFALNAGYTQGRSILSGTDGARTRDLCLDRAAL